MTSIWLDTTVPEPDEDGLISYRRSVEDDGEPITIAIRQVLLAYVMREDSLVIQPDTTQAHIDLPDMEIDLNASDRAAAQTAQRTLDAQEYEELREHRRKMENMNRAERRKYKSMHKLGRVKRAITL